MEVWKSTTTPVSFKWYTHMQNISQTEAWFIVKNKMKTYIQSNMNGHLVETRFMYGLPWSPCEFFQVFTWPECNPLVITMWYSGDFYLIPIPLSSNECFQNTSHKILYQYVSIESSVLSNFFLDSSSLRLTFKYSVDLPPEPLRFILTMTAFLLQNSQRALNVSTTRR